MFTWNGKKNSTNGEIMNAIESIQTREDARAFLDTYRAVTPHADENVGYLSGYFDSEKAAAIRQLFGVKHPVFGDKTPTPEEAFQKGLEMGRAAKSKNLQ